MKNFYLPNERYKLALERIKKQIEEGSDLITIDSDELGDQYTHCSWGLCSNSIRQWPDKEDWLNEHKIAKIISHITSHCVTLDEWINTKYLDKGQHCPIDKDQSKETSPNGCFYRCRIFQDNLKSRQEAIELYKKTIENA